MLCLNDFSISDINSKDLRKFRETIGITQQEAADLIGVSKTTISNIEMGKTTHPLILFGYATFLERCYADSKNYIPAYRKVGTSEFAK